MWSFASTLQAIILLVVQGVQSRRERAERSLGDERAVYKRLLGVAAECAQWDSGPGIEVNTQECRSILASDQQRCGCPRSDGRDKQRGYSYLCSVQGLGFAASEADQGFRFPIRLSVCTVVVGSRFTPRIYR